MSQSAIRQVVAQLGDFISRHTGLKISERHHARLYKTIVGRAEQLSVRDPVDYCHWLTRNSGDTQRELQELVPHLTTGESYFFRDRSQMALLRNQLLPDLIEKNRENRSLRFWSAGCSTGEEAYTLAMLIDELLPERRRWRISILGTDLNRKAIEKAGAGIYEAWSFRQTPPPLQERYFFKRGGTWHLRAEIRAMVEFREGNLLRSPCPFPPADSGAFDLDLILCRNVFIYFEREAVTRVLGLFSDSLREGGYLMTGHTELHGVRGNAFQARPFPESVVYQKGGGEWRGAKPAFRLPEPMPESGPAAPPRPAGLPRLAPAVPAADAARRFSKPSGGPKPLPRPSPSPSPAAPPAFLEAVHGLLRQGQYPGAIEKLEGWLRRHPSDAGALFALAQAYADLGQTEQAIQRCREALAADDMAPRPYFLLGLIAEDQGHGAAAGNYFKKVIYLAPDFVPAYLELGFRHEQENNFARAKKMRTTAFELLRRMPPETIVEGYDTMTAGELARSLEKMI